MKVISTFSGCGGSSTGYKAAGCEVVACVEWDAHAVECYRANHPTTQVFHGDIHKVTGEMLLNATGLDVGELDILDGSPPCQGFSTAGKRVLDDPRNSLFKQQLRLIDELKPKHVVIENVSGMIKGAMKPVAGEVVASLKDRGYSVAAGLLEAQYFGVGQCRQRVFFIGSRAGAVSLPKAISAPLSSKRALVGVEPDELPQMSPDSLWVARELRPGIDWNKVMKEHGREPSKWFGAKMLHPDRPAFCITKTWIAPSTLYHWEKRFVSVREAQVLTGFPASYVLPGAFKDRWARIGNSVAPPMSREIVKQVLGRIPT